jgi:hypothetical protein
MYLQSLSASGASNELHPRAQCAHGRKLLDGKTFNSDAIQRLYESADYPMQQPAPD